MSLEVEIQCDQCSRDASIALCDEHAEEDDFYELSFPDYLNSIIEEASELFSRGAGRTESFKSLVVAICEEFERLVK